MEHGLNAWPHLGFIRHNGQEGTQEQGAAAMQRWWHITTEVLVSPSFKPFVGAGGDFKLVRSVA